MYFFGVWLGLPVACIVFVAVLYHIKGLPFMDTTLGTPFSIAIAVCAWRLCHGIDRYFYHQSDHPKPFYTERSYPEAFGTIKFLLSNRTMGAHAWSLRTIEETQGSIIAFLHFTETFNNVAGPIQAKRVVMLEATVTPVSEEEKDVLFKQYQATHSDEKSRDSWNSKVKLEWTVDAPIRRTLCDKEIETITRRIKEELLVIPKKPQREEKWWDHFIPSKTLLGVTFVLAFLTLASTIQRAEEAMAAQEEQKELEARQQALRLEQERQEQAELQKYQEAQDKIWQAEQNQIQQERQTSYEQHPEIVKPAYDWQANERAKQAQKEQLEASRKQAARDRMWEEEQDRIRQERQRWYKEHPEVPKPANDWQTDGSAKQTTISNGPSPF